ncbi:AAA family ATPase [Nostoc sp. LPT]|uniref:AAA family ATPase n=1 Tax=Nostoc sp. LPT TaxID=2815387 RepID=UPI001DE50BC7|nr:AAA family ATPase [Nostoc sp. LPT]MBN4000861.1 AAA family ATPase [Nostoc sp. LPT]
MNKTSNHSSLLTSNSSFLTSYSALSTQHSALILLIGLPGSGKSTLAKQLLAECPQMALISTDAIRGQLFGSQAVQGPWLLIWREIERQFQQAISTTNTAIFDATNAQRRHRREVITFARNLGFTHIRGIWVDTPVWLCLARNKKRSRQVPEEIILRMHRQLRDAPPSQEEGLDSLSRLSEKSEYGNCYPLVSENHT